MFDPGGMFTAPAMPAVAALPGPRRIPPDSSHASSFTLASSWSALRALSNCLYHLACLSPGRSS
eukprot:5802559-Prorocentrum_lima.AAC.1